MKSKLFLLAILFLGCGNPVEKIKNDSLPNSDSSNQKVLINSTSINSMQKIISENPLHDTTFVDGKHVTFFIPDDNRFKSIVGKCDSSYIGKDNSFGDATTMTIDTIIHNKKFKGIKAIISHRRIVAINDCKNCPVFLDRDSINYGLILSAPGKEFQLEKNIFDGKHYIQLVETYFNLK